MTINFVDQTQRRLLIVEAIGELMATLGDVFNHIRSNPPISLRRQLLMASVWRLKQSQKAALLIAQQLAPEDIWLLARPMFELVISISYLQFSTEDEVLSYISADDASWAHQLVQFKKVMGEEFVAVSSDTRESSKKFAEDAKVFTGRKVEHKGWSTLNLVERAEMVDDLIGLKLFRGLYRDIYTSGNRYIHGNYTAINFFHQILKEIPQDPLIGFKDTNLALSQISKALVAYCVFLDIHLPMGLRSRIEAALEKLNEAAKLSGDPLSNFIL